MSREFTFVLDPVIKEKLETHLGVPEYRVIFRNVVTGSIDGNQKKVLGLHDGANRLITISVAHGLLTGSRLTDAHTSIIHTLLHEYRHAHQEATWPEHKWARDDKRNYRDQECEKDANEWAARNVTKWRSLGRLKVKTRSSLGRLAKAERRLA